MQTITRWIQQTLDVNPQIQGKFLTSVVTIAVLIVLQRVILLFVYRKTKDVGIRYRWRKTTTYVTFGIILFVLGSVWLRGFQSITTYLGLVSAGIAIALQTPLVNLAGWFFILWRRPFKVGDRIQLGDVRGDVIDQRLFMFSVMEIGEWVDADQSTGRVVHVPNGKVFSEPLANYSDGFPYIWNEIAVLVTFESDWKKAKEILVKIASHRGVEFTESAENQIKRAAGKMMIYLSKLTPIVYTSVKDHGVMLTMRYLCNPRRRRGSEQEIWEDILTEFAECPDIDFAYPTQRHYLNHLEGKPEARAKTVDSGSES